MMRASVIAAVAGALALGSCGGDTAEKNDYVDEVNAVTTTLNSGLSEVTSQATSVTSPEQAAGVFSDFAASLDKATAQMANITPPDEVADLQQKLVEDLTTLSDEASNAADEIKAGGAAAASGVAIQFIGEANRISGDVDSTISEINNKLQE